MKKPASFYALTGYVTNRSKEPIINATLYEPATHQVALTNEHGFFYMPLKPGHHEIRVSFMTCLPQMLHLDLHHNQSITIRLEEKELTVNEVIVDGDVRSPLLSTQTGKRTLTAEDINTEYSLLSTPDVVKTLQRESGVAGGVEGSSGLYVHGGENDENLFLLDSSPLYNINHSLGLFSSFNADIIKNVDFYKSGFPARYGGRVSSITDVRTREGDLHHVKGSASLGLLDGRLQLEGPIVKDHTSFNIALRRSWLDLISKPVIAIVNKHRKDKSKLDYLFYDFNARLTHHLNEHGMVWLSLYSGHDHYRIDDKENDSDPIAVYTSDTYNDFRWGNINASLNYSNRFSPQLSMDVSTIYTRSRSNNHYRDDEYFTSYGVEQHTGLDIQRNSSRLSDTGVKADFDWHAAHIHHLRFGGEYLYHTFHPHTSRQAYYFGKFDMDTTKVSSSDRIHSSEVGLYAEDEMHLTQQWSMNIGARASWTSVRGHRYFSLDPRTAMKYQFTDALAAKLSFTGMTQMVHRIASTYLDMPTDYWVSITNKIQPMRSRQIAGGFYAQPSPRWLLTVEGFYKRTRHQLQYRDWMGLQPAANRWDKDVMDGRGRSYGVEADARYTAPALTLIASYTLSWSQRQFDELGKDWFRDKFDNRHKVTVTGRWNISRTTSMYASWLFHSGNRITLPTQYVNLPDLPGDEPQDDAGYAYGKVNNFALPAYHRLDVGFNFRYQTRKGHERVWNLSIYNAYCHLNTMYVKMNRDTEGKIRPKCRGYVPTIPSVSYTMKF